MNRLAVGAVCGLAFALMGACTGDRVPLEVELSVTRVTHADLGTGPRHSVESGYHEITIRQVFTARGPCRELEADLTRDYAAGYLLRVAATELDFPCGDDSPHLEYSAVLKGLPAGRHPLRVVHVGADGQTLAETVLELPVVVTAPPEGSEG